MVYQQKIKKIINMGILAIFLVTLFASVIPNTASAADLAQTSCVTKHTVTAGETISSIAADYGVAWQDLAEANNLTEPYTIYVGQVICIPEGGSSDTSDSTSDDSSSSGQGPSFDVELIDVSCLKVSVIDFPESQSHLVRTGVFNQRWILTNFEVIDRFRTDEYGNATEYVRLPNEYFFEDLVVCVKNAFTDENQCVYIPYED